ncbi:molybdopterin molybdotransferase MoeA [Pedosphaera parvula]|uniref:Molybdopterin molybdenumtransferase n=1 Tax=Pedosphaera parvula (strain Ellin514) TaxID=320771 RepID=B9XRT2_PEDPL|nr:gephyrin-like molybdotransferase Glp [Pedosphaera parvula]EEF57443.1 molybdenum cofactor synthesis domain protein [Pedosphaera parvula Ellin514]
MLELEDAVERILSVLPQGGIETVPLSGARQRVLAEGLFAPINLPVFDNSAMDGYAVRAEDVRTANSKSPVALHVIGRVAAGEMFSGDVVPGTCVRLFTGSPLPKGADAVLMQEDTVADDADSGRILCLDAVKPWENVRLQGEDIKTGVSIGQKGNVISPQLLGLIAALGVNEVTVGRRPVVGLLATGSELVEPGQPLPPGKIYESNRQMLAPLLEQGGAIPRVYPLVVDSSSATQAALEKALCECDLVVTSGGVSVGEMDFVKSAFEQLGGNLQFWKVSIKPGRPFVFGRCGEKFLFGLPGNPVSAFVTFLLLVRPALRYWQGASITGLRTQQGILDEPLSNSGDRRHFVRVTINGAGRVHSAGVQASHMLGSLAEANGLVDIPPKTILPAETVVPVMQWEL